MPAPSSRSSSSRSSRSSTSSSSGSSRSDLGSLADSRAAGAPAAGSSAGQHTTAPLSLIEDLEPPSPMLLGLRDQPPAAAGWPVTPLSAGLDAPGPLQGSRHPPTPLGTPALRRTPQGTPPEPRSPLGLPTAPLPSPLRTPDTPLRLGSPPSPQELEEAVAQVAQRWPVDEGHAANSVPRFSHRISMAEEALPAEHVSSPVRLHIYDVSQRPWVWWMNTLLANQYVCCKFGGFFHVGVEEWMYGHCEAGSGISHSVPGAHREHHFRETVELLPTNLSKKHVLRVIDQELKREYSGPRYNLLNRNCCHFADDLCQRLGAGPIPFWLYRLASIGDVLNKARQNRTVDCISEVTARLSWSLSSPFPILSHVLAAAR
ncbi:unnamed protein product [Prorocentrum cordatum]|uniref:PPPDE domain-containing protein n=1 Tax=Prorocentrum cordatum TaxID=2364126 RepID=A0ABN9W1I0_9DINO|nr:unnamed protein product [Polarella glacialis]